MTSTTSKIPHSAAPNSEVPDSTVPARPRNRISLMRLLVGVPLAVLAGIGAASVMDVVRAESRAQETLDIAHKMKSDPQACAERPEASLMHICSELIAYNAVAGILASMVEEDDLPEYRSLIERGRIYALDHAAPTQLATFRRGLHVVMTVAIGQIESDPAEMSKSVLSGVRTAVELLVDEDTL